MGINIQRSGSTYAFIGNKTKVTGTEQIKVTYNLCYRSGDKTRYVPLVPEGTPIEEGTTISSGSSYYYCYKTGTNVERLKVRVNGTTYNAVNFDCFSGHVNAINAGTYTPQVFRNMILSFIARGRGTKRAVDRATSVTVNNQTVSLAKGALIRYQYQGTSPFNLDFVTFGRSLDTNEFWKPHLDTTGFRTYKAYCVDSGVAGDGHGFYAYYYNYSITVNTGFNFT